MEVNPRQVPDRSYFPELTGKLRLNLSLDGDSFALSKSEVIIHRRKKKRRLDSKFKWSTLQEEKEKTGHGPGANAQATDLPF